MKISVFTSLTNPKQRGDLWKEALNCYAELADETVIINGAVLDNDFFIRHNAYPFKSTQIGYEWPKEFSWEFIGQQFQRAYEACSGDWVIHADLDYIFHEKDYDKIREAFEKYNNEPALSFWKYQFVLPDRYILKSRLVIAVNKAKFGDRIRFDSGGDLCQPSLDGKYISPDDVPEARIPFYNYEKILKTKEQIADDSGRTERAYFKRFNSYQLNSDGDDLKAYEGWKEMSLGRIAKEQKHIPLSDHPKVMQDTIKNLKPEQWGYNAHGNLPNNDYVI